MSVMSIPHTFSGFVLFINLFLFMRYLKYVCMTGGRCIGAAHPRRQWSLWQNFGYLSDYYLNGINFVAAVGGARDIYAYGFFFTFGGY